MYTMCDYCRHIFQGIIKNHMPYDCSYRKGMWCELCCVKGHSRVECPDKKGWALRLGEDPEEVDNLEVVLPANETSVNFVLKYFGHPPEENESFEEKKKRLVQVAYSLSPPRLVIFQ
jgi:hypothetical protein